MKHTLRKTLAALSISLVTTAGAFAAPAPSAQHDIAAGSIAWQATQGQSSVLSVTGPQGTFQVQFENGSQPILGLTGPEGQALVDGSYTYELKSMPNLSQDQLAALEEARANGDLLATKLILPESRIQTGGFTIQGGLFVTPEVEFVERPAATKDSDIGEKAQVFATDLIVDGSACIGIDCDTNESFGFDTLRLKENNLRIKFLDTSASANFPGNDWQLTANDSSNGGANKFSIDDVTGGKTPFTVLAGAPTGSLFINANGDVAVGNSNPVVELHVTDGDSPTLRLQQDGSAGFATRTWDIAGNETNFFVRDVENGSALPFRIRAGAPENSLYISPTGDVALGNQNPSAKLDVVGGAEINGSAVVQGTDGTTSMTITETLAGNTGRDMLTINNTGEIRVLLNNTSNSRNWTIEHSSGGNLLLDRVDDTGTEFNLDKDGNLTIEGSLTASGSTFPTPDYVFEPDYDLMPLEELAEYLKTEKHLPNVPSAQEVMENGINYSQFQMRLLEKVEELTLYTLQQQDTIRELRSELDEIKAR